MVKEGIKVGSGPTIETTRIITLHNIRYANYTPFAASTIVGPTEYWRARSVIPPIAGGMVAGTQGIGGVSGL